ncbi:phosphate ABC transporter substrate-binding protein PstS [Salinibacterium sp. ZJ454]|uniref:phosphate ABC transporter substrate-binding protein PstS n=1 Tax=Salinibacterium sp. ZJ454 TaxID=2708339 RepID=UPI00141DED54|nr:phosphate ABC transporter substrate-binding protein PstS [Salinibacterium sp. ZJ454]
MSAIRASARTAPVWSKLRIAVALLGVVLVTVGSLSFAGVGPASAVGTVHAPIVGSGSTWSANALQAWLRNVWANYQWKITYSESGSTQGRNDFANGTADFGVSEIPYAISDSNEGDEPPTREFAYMPIVAGGTAFMYNLQIAGKKVTNLRLSGETLALIFTGGITVWNDDRIKADNPGLAGALPAIPIVPVVRSDGSGTSAQFSLYMRQQHTAIWDAYCGKVGRPLVNGHCGVTSNYPIVAGSGFVAKAQANGVAGYVAQSHAVGAITFVEYSYALNSGFPVAKMLNAAGYYTEPTAQNVAVALLSARINEDTSSQNYLTQDLSNVYGSPDARVYPLSSYSYIILPTALENGFTENKGLTLADFGSYFLCEGQQSAEVLGYSPLPINLVQAGQSQIQKVPGGNPTIKGITDCNNPTFSPDGSNKLANEAPNPPECDRQGATQCITGTGGAKETSTDPGGTGGGTTDAGTTGPGTTGPGATGGGDGTNGGPGAPGAVDVDAAPVVIAATPQSIPVAAVGILPSLAMVGAGGGMLAFSAVPPILGKRARRRPLLPISTHSGDNR